jgi:hypothetical protein
MAEPATLPAPEDRWRSLRADGPLPVWPSEVRRDFRRRSPRHAPDVQIVAVSVPTVRRMISSWGHDPTAPIPRGSEGAGTRSAPAHRIHGRAENRGSISHGRVLRSGKPFAHLEGGP